ncbi:MAG TPA: hypothetical protein VEY95_17495 [Azospirillaceae bacterium]|nr:hypothetical protein [Azospirillaceae bacterium]
MRFDEIDMQAVSVLIAAMSASIGDDAPATRALREFSANRSQESWDAARALFGRLPSKSRHALGENATQLAYQLRRSDGGVLNLLRTMGRRAAGGATDDGGRRGVMDWLDEQAPKPGGRPTERSWR